MVSGGTPDRWVQLEATRLPWSEEGGAYLLCGTDLSGEGDAASANHM